MGIENIGTDIARFVEDKHVVRKALGFGAIVAVGTTTGIGVKNALASNDVKNDLPIPAVALPPTGLDIFDALAPKADYSDGLDYGGYISNRSVSTDGKVTITYTIEGCKGKLGCPETLVLDPVNVIPSEDIASCLDGYRAEYIPNPKYDPKDPDSSKYIVRYFQTGNLNTCSVEPLTGK